MKLSTSAFNYELIGSKLTLIACKKTKKPFLRWRKDRVRRSAGLVRVFNRSGYENQHASSKREPDEQEHSNPDGDASEKLYPLHPALPHVRQRRMERHRIDLRSHAPRGEHQTSVRTDGRRSFGPVIL